MASNSDEFASESVGDRGNFHEDSSVNATVAERSATRPRHCSTDGANDAYSPKSQYSPDNASSLMAIGDSGVAGSPRHRGSPSRSAAIPVNSLSNSSEKRVAVLTQAGQVAQTTANDVAMSADLPTDEQGRNDRVQAELKSSPIAQTTPSRTRSNFRLPIMSKQPNPRDLATRPSTDTAMKHPQASGPKVITFGAHGTAIAQDKGTFDTNDRLVTSLPKPLPFPKMAKSARKTPAVQAGASCGTSERIADGVRDKASYDVLNNYKDDRWARIEEYLKTTNEDGSRIVANGSQRASRGKTDMETSKSRRNASQSTRPTSNHREKKSRMLRQQDRHKEERERSENDAFLQPLAQMIDDYYLLDDETLVEENRLSTYPIRQVSEVMAKQAALPQATSLLIHQIPPRIVGGVQDRVYTKKITCTCNVKRRSPESRGACLKLSCDCFAIGEYCTESCKCCASCFNNASESNVQPRTEAIVEALKKDPSTFRHALTKIAGVQKKHRIQMLNAASKAKAQYQTDKRRQNGAPPVEMITTQLQPSFYAVPLKVDNGTTVLTGLSFSLTHPRNRKNEQSTKAGEAKPAVPYGKPTGVGETQFQKYWKWETEKMSAFFQAMRARENPAQKPSSWLPFEQTQREATSSYTTVINDIESVKTIVTAAKVDIMARFYQENRLKRGYYAPESTDGDAKCTESNKRNKSSNQYEDQMLCHEEMEPIEESFPKVSDSEMKEMTILVAQDTALLQETSRIIRRMARELCERRMKTERL